MSYSGWNPTHVWIDEYGSMNVRLFTNTIPTDSAYVDVDALIEVAANHYSRAAPVAKSKQYGPERKGRGGKIKRW